MLVGLGGGGNGDRRVKPCSYMTLCSAIPCMSSEHLTYSRVTTAGNTKRPHTHYEKVTHEATSVLIEPDMRDPFAMYTQKSNHRGMHFRYLAVLCMSITPV